MMEYIPFSIDSFGALNTTRVFYKRTHDQYKWERKFVDEFDGRYMLNRTGGAKTVPRTPNNINNSEKITSFSV